MATIAQKNSGTAMKKYCAMVSAWSLGLPTCVAEWMPSASPSTATRMNAHTASSAERPSASPTSGAIGRCIISERPRSPWSTPPSQRPYCTYQGSLSPSEASSSRICSLVAYWPRIACATLPGSSIVIAKMRNDITATIATTWPSRRAV